MPEGGVHPAPPQTKKTTEADEMLGNLKLMIVIPSIAATFAACTDPANPPIHSEYSFIGKGPRNGEIFPSSAGSSNLARENTTSLCLQIDPSRPHALLIERRKRTKSSPDRWNFLCLNDREFATHPATKHMGKPMPVTVLL
jgi:hypothetical protein